MPKIIFENKSEIPEHLKDSASEVDGKYELDAAPILKKNKELLGKNATLTTKLEEAEAAKEAADAQAAEYKGKAKIPAGHKIVANDIAELGEAVKASGLKPDEVSSLKTKVDEYEREKTEGEKKALKTKALAAAGVTNTDLALSLRQSDDLEFEEIDGKYHVVKDGKKTLFDASYLKAADGFKDVFDKLTTIKEKKTPFPETGGGEAGNIFERIKEQEKKRSEETKTRTVDEAFGRAN